MDRRAFGCHRAAGSAVWCRRVRPTWALTPNAVETAANADLKEARHELSRTIECRSRVGIAYAPAAAIGSNGNFRLQSGCPLPAP